MKYRIHFHQEIEAGELEAALTQAARETLKTEQVEAGSLTIVVTDEAAIQELNNKYAGMNRPTDVLAFPGGSPDPDDQGLYYGDVVIALPIAQQQASFAGHSTVQECALLVVHGTLHLLGYDHASLAEQNEMWSRQGLILKHLGLPAIEPKT